ncbi:MAG: cobalt-precorrin-7 (C(5))-methyltransferase [Chloroflexota bacterium]
MRREGDQAMSPPERVICAGIGPGDPRLVTIAAREAIAAAAVVSGFATAVAVVRPWITGVVMPMSYRDQEEVLARVAAEAHAGRRCVVCVYCGLNVSASELLTRVRRHCGEVALLPGISSVQVALARAGLALEQTLFVTLHARGEVETHRRELAEAMRARARHVIALPTPYDFMPRDIARYLLAEGIEPARSVSVYQRLTLPEESALHTTLGALAEEATVFSDLSILVFPLPVPEGTGTIVER